MKTGLRGRRGRQGFTLIEMALTVAIIGAFLAIVSQSMIAYETRTRAQACVSNLIRIDSAVRQWALDGHKSDTQLVGMSDLVGADRYLNDTPQCPAGGLYPSSLAVSAVPTCTIGINGTTTTTWDDHVLP